MDKTEIIDVRVVETQSNYAETVKNAAIAGVVTVLVTTATTAVLQNLNARLERRKINAKIAQMEAEATAAQA